MTGTVYESVGEILMENAPRAVRRDAIMERLGLPMDMVHTAVSELRKLGFVVLHVRFSGERAGGYALVGSVDHPTTNGGQGGAGRKVLRPAVVSHVLIA